MRNLTVVTAVCFLFLLKLKWPKNKNIYDVTYLYDKLSSKVQPQEKEKSGVRLRPYLSLTATCLCLGRCEEVRLDYQPLFGKGAHAPPRGGLTRHKRAAEIEPMKRFDSTVLLKTRKCGHIADIYFLPPQVSGDWIPNFAPLDSWEEEGSESELFP